MTRDFNEDMGENHNELMKLLVMELIDVHLHKHDFDYDVVTYSCGSW